MQKPLLHPIQKRNSETTNRKYLYLRSLLMPKPGSLTAFNILIVFMTLQISLIGQFSPLRIGSSAQAHSSLYTNQNQVAVDHATNSIVFVHTQNTNLFGGGLEQQTYLRYDLSTDGGTTFTTDIGPVISNATLSRPQVVLRNDGAWEAVDSVRTVFLSRRVSQVPNGPFLLNQFHLLNTS